MHTYEEFTVSLGARGICGGNQFAMLSWETGTTYPLGLPWLFCGILMEEAFLKSSWRASSEAAYARLLTIKVFDSLSPPPMEKTQCCRCKFG